MSADSIPITPTRFAAALKDLSVGSLHAKVAELQNSINHLRTSNSELEDYLRAQPTEQRADPDLVDAIQENVEVMDRMEARIAMIKQEVEQRGMMWPSEREIEEPKSNTEIVDTPTENGIGESHTNGARPPPAGEQDHAGQEGVSEQRAQQSGRFTDEELARRLRERMGADENDEEDGLHL